MAILDAAERKEIPSKEYGLPSERKYPIPDRSHAANAKARAKQMLDRGKISQSQYNEICAKADAKLGESM